MKVILKTGKAYTARFDVRFRTELISAEPTAVALFVSDQDGELKAMAVDEIQRIEGQSGRNEP
jgi:hypothetical protein